MAYLLRCALCIGVVYALSPVDTPASRKDADEGRRQQPLRLGPAELEAAQRLATKLGGTWSTLDPAVREALLSMLAKERSDTPEGRPHAP